MEAAKPIMPHVTFRADPYSVAEGADALAIVTEWDAFRALDLERLAGLMAHPVLVDLRNVYKPEEARALGFAYSSVGRP
jgi:UDPglucose 6-dehydrogenase